MMRTLAWKEWREQQNVWMAMAILGAMIVVGLAKALASPQSGKLEQTDVTVLFTLALGTAGIYGLVCGAMLLAGEEEEGTLPLLDRLVGLRSPIFRTKLLMGFGLISSYAALLALLLATVPDARHPIGWEVLTVFLVVLEAYACGLLGSALWRTSLGATGCGLLVWLLSWSLSVLIVAAAARIFGLSSSEWLPGVIFLAARLVLDIGAILVARRIFCRPDIGRRERAVGVRRKLVLALLHIFEILFRRRVDPEWLERMSAVRILPSWKSALWLTFRQSGRSTIGVAIVALFLGVTVPTPVALALWPLLTVILGVWCGISVFGGETHDGEARFLGEQRLPLGRIWAVKSLAWLVTAFGIAGLMIAGSLSFDAIRAVNWRSESATSNDFLFPFLRATGSLPAFLATGLVFGFGIGQVCGLICRKFIVAAVASAFLALGAICLWLPSVLAGGTSVWQILVTPVLLLVACHRSLWPWTGERLTERRPLFLMFSWLLLAVVATGAFLLYRAYEMPDVGEPFDVASFEASLPKVQQNRAAELLLKADAALAQHQLEVEKEVGTPTKLFGPGRPELDAQFGNQLPVALAQGWPKEEPELGRWLDRMFEGQWLPLLREAIAMPPGTLVDLEKDWAHQPVPSHLGQAAQLLVVRGLQEQAHGRPEAALDYFRLALALSRRLRSHTFSVNYFQGVNSEQDILRGLETWSKSLGKRPELLQQALSELTHHEEQNPPYADAAKAEYLYYRREVQQPESALKQVFRILGSSLQGDSLREAELHLMAACLKAPWEQERSSRLLRLYTAGGLRSASLEYWQTPEMPRISVGQDLAPGYGHTYLDNSWQPPAAGDASGISVERFAAMLGHSHMGMLLPGAWWKSLSTYFTCRSRVTRLELALQLFQIQEGRPAERLEELVPKYLPAVPIDPYGGQAFHYRLSKGEQLLQRSIQDHATAFQPEDVPAGTGILWSVGPDREDNGGHRQGDDWAFLPEIWRSKQLDWIFLVPPPASTLK